MVESPSDLLAFCDPAEFGERAILTVSGVAMPEITGIPDTYAEEKTPGGNDNSGRGSFTTGAANVAVHIIQFVSTNPLAATAKAEGSLEILGGVYAGMYRITRVARDGAITRLMLNIKT